MMRSQFYAYFMRWYKIIQFICINALLPNINVVCMGEIRCVDTNEANIISKFNRLQINQIDCPQ